VVAFLRNGQADFFALSGTERSTVIRKGEPELFIARLLASDALISVRNQYLNCRELGSVRVLRRQDGIAQWMHKDFPGISSEEIAAGAGFSVVQVELEYHDWGYLPKTDRLIVNIVQKYESAAFGKPISSYLVFQIPLEQPRPCARPCSATSMQTEFIRK
jgi:hypothetical protein